MKNLYDFEEKIRMVNSKSESEKAASNIIKSELAQQGLKYKVLEKKFEAMGLNYSVKVITIKLFRGTFSFLFSWNA